MDQRDFAWNNQIKAKTLKGNKKHSATLLVAQGISLSQRFATSQDLTGIEV